MVRRLSFRVVNSVHFLINILELLHERMYRTVFKGLTL